MVPKFDDRYEGTSWMCLKTGCANENDPKHSVCVNCSKCVPPNDMALIQESIFKRYERLTQEEVDEDEASVRAKDDQDIRVPLEKRKHQINMLIKVLESLPRINSKGD